MADNSKPPKSDERPNPNPPLEEAKVKVDVKPRTNGGDDKQYAEKVKKHLQSEVEKAVKKQDGDSSADQFRRGEDKVEEAAKHVDGGKVKEVSVDIGGKVGKNEVKERHTFQPDPPPAPAAPKTPPAKGGSATPMGPVKPPPAPPPPVMPPTPKKGRRK